MVGFVSFLPPVSCRLCPRIHAIFLSEGLFLFEGCRGLPRFPGHFPPFSPRLLLFPPAWITAYSMSFLPVSSSFSPFAVVPSRRGSWPPFLCRRPQPLPDLVLFFFILPPAGSLRSPLLFCNSCSKYIALLVAKSFRLLPFFFVPPPLSSYLFPCLFVIRVLGITRRI